MRTTRLARFWIVGVGVGLIGCRTSVAGHYRLDLEDTKRCVEKAAVANPEDAGMKEGTIKMLSATDLDLELNAAGKMVSTTTLSFDGSRRSQVRNGAWRMDGKRVTITVEDEKDTTCDVDGTRLRCTKPDALTLFSHYVLVRK